MSIHVSSKVERARVGSAPKCSAILRKAVLKHMADRASDDGTGIWTSKVNIAADVEGDVSAVRRAMKQMESEGLIERTGTRPYKTGETVEYRIVLEAIDQLESTRHKGGSGTRAGQVPGQGGSGTRPRAGQVPDKPSLEPSLEPSLHSTRECEQNYDYLFKEEEESEPTPAKSQAQRVALSKGWVPSYQDREYALEKGLTDLDISETADNFECYWTEGDGSGKKRTERGWGQAWRDHILNVAPKFKRNRGGEAPKKMSSSDLINSLPNKYAKE